MKFLWLAVAFLVAVLSCEEAFGYKSPPRGGGGYQLPPGVQPWNPGRHQGLPPAYHGKFKRSVNDDVEPTLDEAPLYLAREKRSSGYRIILPTYRPPPRRPQRPIYV